MSAQWMPLYVGDYLRDTRRLTTLEHGAYLLLIMEYWTNGGLPDDDRRLARIAGLSAEDWEAVRPALAELFEDGWRHKRIDLELARATEKSQAARAAAELRWQRGRKADAVSGHSARNAKADADAHATEYANAHAKADAGAYADAMLPEPQPQPDPEPEKLNTKIRETSLGGVVASQPPEPRRRRAKPRVPIAEVAQPDDRDRDYARGIGLGAEQFRIEWRKFRDHHLKLGSRFADWNAAWRGWCDRIGDHRPQARAGPSSAPAKGFLADFERELAERRRNGTHWDFNDNGGGDAGPQVEEITTGPAADS